MNFQVSFFMVLSFKVNTFSFRGRRKEEGGRRILLRYCYHILNHLYLKHISCFLPLASCFTILDAYLLLLASCFLLPPEGLAVVLTVVVLVLLNCQSCHNFVCFKLLNNKFSFCVGLRVSSFRTFKSAHYSLSR